MTVWMCERARSIASQSSTSSLFKLAGGLGWEVKISEVRDRSFAGVEAMVVVVMVGEGAVPDGVQGMFGDIEVGGCGGEVTAKASRRELQ